MEIKYDILHPWRTLDQWQKDVILYNGNIVVRSGRQSGKSTAIAVKVGDYALRNPKKTILIIAAVERQAYALFLKILAYIESRYPRQTKGRVTMTFAEFRNGSIIRCLPAGMDGRGIRGYTIDLLVADEAAFIPAAVFQAISPMVAITKGKIVLLSTPFGKGERDGAKNYFYECFSDPTFKKFHVSTEDCPRMQSQEGKDFLAAERTRMTKLQYSQEYLGEFVDDLRQFFSTELIRSCMSLESSEVTPLPDKDYFLGVDIASKQGKDDSTFEIIDRTNRENVYHLKNIVKPDNRITDTIRDIKELEEKYCFNKIYIDTGGMGQGVFDDLIEQSGIGRKIIDVNNSSKSLTRERDRQGKPTGKKTALNKDAMYFNIKRMMEQNQLKLIKDAEVFQSFKSVQYEYKDGKVIFFGRYTHIVEGLIRACWSVKDKSLNPSIN